MFKPGLLKIFNQTITIINGGIMKLVKAILYGLLFTVANPLLLIILAVAHAVGLLSINLILIILALLFVSVTTFLYFGFSDVW